jgi:D-tyrosyl-tRNA(Tyr) deacylase
VLKCRTVRAVVQRVHRARVRVGDEVVGSIGHGLCVLLGVTGTDTDGDADVLCRKIVALRIFADDAGHMNRSVGEVGGAMLVVSQFTLYAECRRGRRPSFAAAAPAPQAATLYERFLEVAGTSPVPTQAGRFGADMTVELENDGPVTIILDTADLA